MGSQEQIRNIDATKLISNMNSVYDALVAAGFPENQLVKIVDEGAEHNEAAWASRFPAIAEWLFQP